MYNRKMLWTIMVIPLLLSAFSLPAVRAQSSSSPTVALVPDALHTPEVVDPTTIKVFSGPGDTLGVNLVITDVVDLAAYDITLRYPGGFITVADATLAGTLFDNATNPSVDVLLFDIAPDFIRVAVNFRGPLSVSGSGNLLSMNFNVNDFGVGRITIPSSTLTLVDVNIEPIIPARTVGTLIVDAGTRVDVTLINRSTQTDFGHVLNIRLEGNIAIFKSRIKNIGTDSAVVFARFELRTGDRTLTDESNKVTLAPGQETELFGRGIALEDAPLRYAVTGSIWMSPTGLFFIQSPHGIDTLTFKVLPTCYPNC